MGKYINVNSKGEALPAMGKAKSLLNDGANIINPDNITKDNFPDTLVCVVENPFFDAAGYAFSYAEFEAFNRQDGRPKTWLLYQHAPQLAT